MHTHYDTLGIVPASDRLAINDAYISAVTEVMPSQGFPHGSMKWHQGVCAYCCFDAGYASVVSR